MHLTFSFNPFHLQCNILHIPKNPLLHLKENFFFYSKNLLLSGNNPIFKKGPHLEQCSSTHTVIWRNGKLDSQKRWTIMDFQSLLNSPWKKKKPSYWTQVNFTNLILILLTTFASNQFFSCKNLIFFIEDLNFETWHFLLFKHLSCAGAQSCCHTFIHTNFLEGDS